MNTILKYLRKELESLSRNTDQENMKKKMLNITFHANFVLELMFKKISGNIKEDVHLMIHMALARKLLKMANYCCQLLETEKTFMLKYFSR